MAMPFVRSGMSYGVRASATEKKRCRLPLRKFEQPISRTALARFCSSIPDVVTCPEVRGRRARRLQ